MRKEIFLKNSLLPLEFKYSQENEIYHIFSRDDFTPYKLYFYSNKKVINTWKVSNFSVFYQNIEIFL